MTDLQLTLVILGAFIIAGVVAYNWLQERKLRKQVSSDFIVPQKDVLTDDFHINADAYAIDKELAEVEKKGKPFEHTIPDLQSSTSSLPEPSIGLQANIDEAPAVDDLAMQSIENTEQAELAAIHPTPDLAQANAATPIIKAVLPEKLQDTQINLPDATHPQVDLTAILFATKNISANQLQDLRASLANVGLPNSINGLSNDDKWHVIDDKTTESFKQVACSLQLADRGGPVAKNVLNKFQFAAEDAGLSLNAHVEWQGSGDAMQRALELDQFCIEVDQLVSVHVARSEMPIHGTKFKGLAEANGLILKDDGKFYHLVNDAVLFTVIDTNNVPFTAESLRSNVLKSITFQIEIPKVANSEQVFNQMIMMAQKMASSLSGQLVDDNQKPLGDLQIEKIRQQLKVIHATMVARGIMPGSAASMRLFN